MKVHNLIPGWVERLNSPDVTPAGIVATLLERDLALAVVTSFQASGLVILDLVRRIEPNIPVIFLDTGFHFEETLEFRDRIVSDWDLNLQVLKGAHGSVEKQSQLYGDELYARDPDRCCAINKVAPLQAALEAYDGWMSGLRKDQSAARSDVEVVGYQTLESGRSVLMLHPLAHWSRGQVDAYLEANEIPVHPLLERGFESVGCWPCTRFVGPHEEKRAGRWYGMDKTECGIHTIGVRSNEEGA